MKCVSDYQNTDSYICEMLKTFKLVDIRENYLEEIEKARRSW